MTVRHLEVVQTVQDLSHSVPLIADRQTVVRLYLDPSSFTRAGSVTGEIAWHSTGGEAYLPATNAVAIDPAAPLTIDQQRAKAENSILFRLPPEAVRTGRLTLRVSRLTQPGGSDIAFAASAPVTVDFTSAPPLRIRAIGLRYRAGTRMVAPAAVHFSYLRSYLQRAYPTAQLIWSQIVVDADFAPPFNNGDTDSTADKANMQIAAIRSREIAGGVDPRTHYFGLVDDDGRNNFMRGKAYDIPSSAQPDIVASGPTGVPNGYLGDFDPSYADWYGAHELGHTFGRSHPGFPPGEQDASDPGFPYADGCISAPDGRFAGFDVGDAALGIPMSALPGREHHDIMTYSERQWISAYTFSAILDRLIEEDAL